MVARRGRRSNRTSVSVFEHIDMRGGDKEVCWPFIGKLGGKDGRPYLRIQGKAVLVYREVYKLMHGVELTSSDILLHKCDNPACCNPNHLTLGDHSANMQDMSLKGRARNANGNGRLPIPTIVRIRQLIKQGFTQPEIVLDVKQNDGLDITRSTVAHIKNGLTYRGVGEESTGTLPQTVAGTSGTGQEDSE